MSLIGLPIIDHIVAVNYGKIIISGFSGKPFIGVVIKIVEENHIIGEQGAGKEHRNDYQQAFFSHFTPVEKQPSSFSFKKHYKVRRIFLQVNSPE